jgi:hypothetical protein
MNDRFDFQRKLDNLGSEIADSARERLEEEREAERERERRLVKLSVGYYFDPKEMAILRKVGSRFIFVRHDRRAGRRRTQAEAESRQFRMIQGGLFWDEKAKKLYRKAGAHYVLYTRDRRRAEALSDIKGTGPGGKERRKRSGR